MSYDNYCKHCEHDHTAASVLRGEQLKIRKRLEAELEQAQAAVEWRKSILGLLKSHKEWERAEWAGDKDGWGFCFEFVRRFLVVVPEQLEQARADLEGRYTLEDLCAIRADSKRFIAAADELAAAVKRCAEHGNCSWNVKSILREACAKYDAAKGGSDAE